MHELVRLVPSHAELRFQHAHDVFLRDGRVGQELAGAVGGGMPELFLAPIGLVRSRRADDQSDFPPDGAMRLALGEFAQNVLRGTLEHFLVQLRELATDRDVALAT